MDIEAISKSLEFFVSKHKVTFERLGTRQTQILELAGTVGVTQHYNASGYQVSVVNPKKGNVFVVKTGTRGNPCDYSRIVCTKEDDCIEIHMNTAVRGAHDEGIYCVDVALVRKDAIPLKRPKAKWLCLPNEDLMSFAEVKKLVVYPMLLAQFVGIVHEIKPEFLSQPSPEGFGEGMHLPPTLIALGHFSGNSRAIVKAFPIRGFHILITENYDMKLALARRTSASPFYESHVETVGDGSDESDFDGISFDDIF